MNYDKIHHTLKQVGFKDIEAKIYTLLIKNPLISGYSIAINTGYTKSQVNQALSQMVEKKFIRAQENKTLLYETIEIECILNERRSNEYQALDEIHNEFEEQGLVDTGIDVLHEIENHPIAMQEIVDYIETSKFKIAAQVNAQIYKYIESYLIEAVKRGVNVFVVLPSKCEGVIDVDSRCVVCFKDHQNISIEDDKYTLLMIFDKETCIYGGISEQKEKYIITKNIPFIRILSEFTSAIFTYNDFSKIFDIEPVEGLK